MRRKYRAAILLLIGVALILGAMLFVLLKPGRWSGEIVNFLNDNVLKQNGWSMSIGSLEGRFTSDVYFRNLYLRRDDGSAVVFSEKAKVNLDFSRILGGDWAISTLSLQDGFITVKSGGEVAGGTYDIVNQLASRGLQIRELNLSNMALIIQSESDEYLYNLTFGGRLESRGTRLTLIPEEVQIADVGNRTTVQLGSGKIDLSAKDLTVRSLRGRVNGVSVDLDGSVTFSDPMKWIAEGTGRGLVLSHYVDGRIARAAGVDTVDIQFQVETDLISAAVRGSLFPHDGGEILGDMTLHLVRDSQQVILNQAIISSKSARIIAGGILRNGRDLSLRAGIQGLDLTEFGFAGNPTLIGGSLTVSGALKDRKGEEITIDVDLFNGQRGQQGFVRSTGRMVYADDRLGIVDSLKVEFEYGTLLAKGEIDIRKERAELFITPSEVDLESIGYLAGMDSLTGTVGGAVEVLGFLRDPIANGYLTVKNGEFSPASWRASSLTVSFRVNSIFQNPQGFLRAVLTDGTVGKFAVEEGNADVFFRGDTVLVEGVRLTRGKDFFHASGRMIAGRSFRVNQVQLSLGDNTLTSIGPIAVERERDALKVEPSIIQVNNGRAEVSLSVLDSRLTSASLRLTNLSLSTLWKILGLDIPLTGDAFADVSAGAEGDRLKATGVFEVRDGTWKEIDFDRLQMTASIDDNALDVREFRVTGSGNMMMELSGFAGVNPGRKVFDYDLDPSADMGVSGEFQNFRLELLSALWPSLHSIGGSITGSLIATGAVGSPELVFESTIEDPRLGQTSAEVISGSGRYTDRRLYIQDMVAETKGGHITANGYVPVNLAFGTGEEDLILTKDPLSMTFHGKSTSLSYLTPYISSIDSVSGDINFELTLSGTISAPVRNGRISVKDGTIYAFHLDSPIRGLNGNAVLENNQLIIEDLTASSDIPPKMDFASQLKSNLSTLSRGALFPRRQKKESPNIRVTGSMDLTEFFNPGLAFLVTGKEVYVRTLLGEIEGIANLRLSVTGKDTVDIVGDIVPHQAVLRMEFSGKEGFNEVRPEGPGLTRYLIHFPISGNVLLRNSQIDAELSGDITIQKTGSSPSRYSGELDLLGGKFYYYSDVFEIQEGHLVFDPTEFNPQMNIHATTTISNIKIGVTLSGTFEEPVMLIADSEQNYSQDDLLQLLTIQKRFNQQDLTTKGLGDQSVYLFGKFLKSEIERSLVRSTPLLDEFEIQGSPSLLGSPGDQDLALMLGTRPSPNLYLSYRQSFSLAEPSQVGVEYRLNPNVSLVVTYDDDGQMHLKYRRKYKF